MTLSKKQLETLRKPLNATRIAKRSQGGKQLSYLESWDVRAHLIRMFGYGNFDIETIEQAPINQREYTGNNDKEMVEVSWFAKVRLIVRDPDGDTLCTYTETAVGSTSGPANMIGEHHDNAVKTAASDALKRCAINLGTQFGLSLYDNGSTHDVVKGTLVNPYVEEVEVTTADGQVIANLQHSLGASDPVVEEPAQTETA